MRLGMSGQHAWELEGPEAIGWSQTTLVDFCWLETEGDLKPVFDLSAGFQDSRASPCLFIDQYSTSQVLYLGKMPCSASQEDQTNFQPWLSAIRWTEILADVCAADSPLAKVPQTCTGTQVRQGRPAHLAAPAQRDPCS